MTGLRSSPSLQEPSLRAKWSRILGSSILDQALLSAANFIVGLILIRYADDAQYGYYILMFNAVMLLTMLQNSFTGTPLVITLPKLSDPDKRYWVGSVYVDHWRVLIGLSVILLVPACLLWWFKVLANEQSVLIVAAITATIASLYREFFRNTLLIFQRPQTVLKADLAYSGILTAGCFVAVLFPFAAAVAMAATALSAIVCGYMLWRWMRDLIDPHAPSGQLMKIAPIGLWAATGSGVYWLLNQGYSFITAFTLDVAAVGALAAARLLMMPINLVCTGVQKQLTPAASHWLHSNGGRFTMQRLCRLALAMGAVVIAYTLLVWLLRDWIFLDLLRKDHAQRNELLLLWASIFFVKALRDPPMLILMLRQRFRLLTFSSLICASLALVLCYVLTGYLSTAGALWGMLIGESISLVLTLLFAWKESRAQSATPLNTTGVR